jgi:Scavenger mRNA decapping enzyme C-term binding
MHSHVQLPAGSQPATGVMLLNSTRLALAGHVWWRWCDTCFPVLRAAAGPCAKMFRTAAGTIKSVFTWRLTPWNAVFRGLINDPRPCQTQDPDFVRPELQPGLCRLESDCVSYVHDKQRLVNVQVFSDDDFVVIRDKFPKARLHLLVIPRDPELLDLSCLRRQHLPVLGKMRELGEHWAQQVGSAIVAEVRATTTSGTSSTHLLPAGALCTITAYTYRQRSCLQAEARLCTL